MNSFFCKLIHSHPQVSTHALPKALENSHGQLHLGQLMSRTECANPQVCTSWLYRPHALRRPEPLMFSRSDLVPSRHLVHPTLTQSKEGCIDETSLTCEAERDRRRFKSLNPRWCYGYAGPAVGPGFVFTVFARSMFCTIFHHLPTFAHFLLLWEHFSGFCYLLRLRPEPWNSVPVVTRMKVKVGTAPTGVEEAESADSPVHAFTSHGLRIRSQLRQAWQRDASSDLL